MSAFLIARNASAAVIGFATIPEGSSIDATASDLILACGLGAYGSDATPHEIAFEEHGVQRWARPLSAFGFAAGEAPVHMPRHEGQRRAMPTRRRSA